ncbi:putative low complexity protein [Cryptosporidium felis]|nr:putative low complexity protein [Cryptosporidium felis]
MEDEIHVVYYHPRINWDLLANYSTSKKNTHNTLDQYNLGHSLPLCSSTNKIVENLSKVFSRIISNELQCGIRKKHEFFVSSSLNEKLYKINPYSRSTQIYQDIIDVWLRLEQDIKTRVIDTCKQKRTNQLGDQMVFQDPSKNFDFRNIIQNIVKNCGDVNKSITIWSIIPEYNVDLNEIFELKEESIILRSLEGLINICFCEIQREFYCLKNTKINLNLVISYSKNLLSLNSNKIPVIVSNRSNSQYQITCLDSRCLLSYSDVLIANTLNMQTLRLDFSNILENNTFVTLFSRKDNFLLNYIESESKQNEFKKLESSDFSDSEEGEVIEQEDITVISDFEFRNQGWSKLVDIIHLKILNTIPSHWNPTAIRILPLASPVGRNNKNLLSTISNILNMGGLLLGKNNAPMFALTNGISEVVFEYSDNLIKKNGSNKSFDIAESNCVLNNGFYFKSVFSLLIIDRNPIIPVPVSRKFQCEGKISSTCSVGNADINTYLLFTSNKIKQLLKLINFSIKLTIYKKINIIGNYSISENLRSITRKNPRNRLGLNENLEISKTINILFTAIPTLLLDTNDLFSEISMSKVYSDELDEFKLANLHIEKNHLELNLEISKVKLMDVIFPTINGKDRKMILQSLINSEINGKTNRKRDLESLISKLNGYLSVLFGDTFMDGCIFCCDGINSDQMSILTSSRNILKQSAPKIFWLSVSFLLDSMKFLSKEHQKIYYIINNKELEFPARLEIPVNKAFNNFESNIYFPENDTSISLIQLYNFNKFDSFPCSKRLDFE